MLSVRDEVTGNRRTSHTMVGGAGILVAAVVALVLEKTGWKLPLSAQDYLVELILTALGALMIWLRSRDSKAAETKAAIASAVVKTEAELPGGHLVAEAKAVAKEVLAAELRSVLAKLGPDVPLAAALEAVAGPDPAVLGSELQERDWQLETKPTTPASLQD